MALGTVKWFNRKKGYGFIVEGETDRDVFVHYSNIEGEGFRSLKHGDKVEYELVESERGPQGRHVRRVGPAETEARDEAGSGENSASPPPPSAAEAEAEAEAEG